MKNPSPFGLLLCLAALLSGPVLAAVCPPEGDGGDGLANRQKNRVLAPPSVTELEIDQFLKSFNPNLNVPVLRAQFSPAATAEIVSREQQGVALLGYLLLVKQSGTEAAHCHDRKRRSLELWVGTLPVHTRARSKAVSPDAVVATVTPVGQDTHLNWRLADLRKLAREGAKVRISGWVFYDAEHPEQLDTTRASLWQIHPVTRIEVWRDGAWKDF
jgi:hypothetical protein